MQSVSLILEPGQLLASWREKTGTLFLPALSESRVGDEVAIRLGIYGHTIRATLFGKVALVRRVGRPALPPGIDLQLEKNSLAAAGFLAAAARGEPVSFRERPPRFVCEHPLVIERAGVVRRVVTANIAEGGAAVHWPGPLPLVGDELLIKVKDGFFTRGLAAIVCWNQPGGDDERMVGLKVNADGRGGRAWHRLVESVSRRAVRTA